MEDLIGSIVTVAAVCGVPFVAYNMSRVLDRFSK